jgi:hypothetical protein
MFWPVAAAAAAMPSGVTSQPSGFGRDRSQPAARKKSSMPAGVQHEDLVLVGVDVHW